MSKLAKKLGFSLGLEDDAPAADITINVETDEEGTPLAGTTLDGENTVEADQVETAEAEGEVEETNGQVEELEEAQETLENYYVALEHYNRNGGMNREAAGMMAIGVAGVTRKFGIGLEDLNISVESFGDNRQRATTVSMEGIRDMLAEIWRKIKELMFKMWKALKNFYMKLFSGAVRLKKRAEGIKKKASNTTKGIGEKKIEVGVLKQLHIGGKAPDAAQLEKSLEVYQHLTDATVKGGFDKVSTAVTTAIDKVADMDPQTLANACVGIAVVAWGASQAVASMGHPAQLHQVKRFVSDATTNANSLATPELPGGKVLVFVAQGVQVGSTPQETIEKSVRGVRFGITRAAEKSKEIDSTGTFETLSTGQIENLCSKVIDIADNVRLYEKIWDKREKGLKEIQTAGDKAVKSIEKDDDQNGSVKKLSTSVIQNTTTMIRSLVNLEQQINSQAISTCSSVLNLCVASLRAHDDK